MKTLRQVTGKLKWLKPQPDAEFDEVKAQLSDDEMPSEVHDELKDIDDHKDYDKFLERGKLKKIKPSKGDKILNYTYDPGDYEKLAKDKRAHVEAEYRSGYVHAPIILKSKADKKMYLLAGNTRTCYAFEILHRPIKAWVIKY